MYPSRWFQPSPPSALLPPPSQSHQLPRGHGEADGQARVADKGLQTVRSHSEQLVPHPKAMAAASGRPYRHLRCHTRKDEEARRIAQRDGIDNGLVCVFSALGMSPTFKIAYDQTRPRIQFARRKCLCL